MVPQICGNSFIEMCVFGSYAPSKEPDGPKISSNSGFPTNNEFLSGSKKNML